MTYKGIPYSDSCVKARGDSKAQVRNGCLALIWGMQQNLDREFKLKIQNHTS